MQDRQRDRVCRRPGPDSATDVLTPSAPNIDVDDIFRKLIEDELRNGRLTRARRRRIIRYAARLRMSAVQAGQLIEACRRKLLEDSEPGERRQPLQPIEPRPVKVPAVFKVSLIVALAVLVDLLLFKWVW